MTDVASIVQDALGHLGVIDPGEPVSAEQMTDAIRTLNLMLARWEADGVTLGWAPVSQPTDTLPAPAEAEECIGYHLAIRLRSRYGRAIGPDVIQMATDGLASLRADVLANEYVRLRYDDLPRGEGQSCYGDQSAFLAGA